MERVSTPAAYGASGICAAIGGWSANEIAAYGGLLFALLTWLTNLYFQWRRDQRESTNSK